MSNNNLKIIILVLSFIIVGLVGNIIILNDVKANPVVAPVESDIELPEIAEQLQLPEVTPEPETPELSEEAPEIEQPPQVQEPMTNELVDQEADRYFLEMNKYADEDGFVVDDGVLVKYIGYSSNVTIPESVLIIGEGAFEDCFMLENVTIPDNVMVIDDRAFYNCNKLTYITQSSNIIYVGEKAFYETPWFNNLNQEYNIIGDGVLIKYVMQNSNDITLPNSVKSIVSYAFMDCTSLQSVTFSNSVISVGANAFSTCWSLSEINLNPTLLHVGDYAFNDTPWFYDLDEEFVVLGDGVLVKFNSYETVVVVPDNVKNISAGVFENINYITTMALPTTLNYIGERAFAGCISLEKMNFPSSVSYIGDDAFEETIWFENLSDEFCIIGDCILVKYNGNNATVVIPDGVKSISKGVFSSAYSMVDLIIPTSVVEINEEAFNYYLYIDSIKYFDELKLQPIVDRYAHNDFRIIRTGAGIAQAYYKLREKTGLVDYCIYVSNNGELIEVGELLDKDETLTEWRPNFGNSYQITIGDGGEIWFAQILQ